MKNKETLCIILQRHTKMSISDSILATSLLQDTKEKPNIKFLKKHKAESILYEHTTLQMMNLISSI